MKDLIVLKVGGSVITDKFSEQPKVNEQNLRRIVKEISSVYDKDRMSLVFIHGVGSFGHPIVKRTGIHEGIEREEQLIAFAETQRLQNELNNIVTKLLIEEGVPAFPCQASSFAVMESKKLVKMDIEAIKGLIEIGIIPVLYGVPAYDKKQKSSILSGDQIAPYLGSKLNAKRIIHGTNVAGIFTSDPKKNPKARLIPEINKDNIDKVKEYLTGSTATDVTGGMFGKIMEVMNVGIEAQIINALIPNNIVKAMMGEEIGTIIRP